MTFVGDRFISVGHQWLDIVTGQAALVRVGAKPPDVAARERLCRARWSTIDAGPRLIDFGEQGASNWFEAERTDAMSPPAALRRLLWRQVAGIADAIASACPPSHVTITAPAGAGFQMLCEQLARMARAGGFVTVRADAAIPYRLRRQLMHRHLVLLAPTDAARARAAEWLAHLSLVSNRRHVLIERARESVGSGLALEPFAVAELIGAVAEGDIGAGDLAAVHAAAEQSGGWPAAFVREWALRSNAVPVVRERGHASYSAPVAVAFSRDVARAASYAKRRRPAAESEWHSAAVAAASRRGDAAGVVRATERWVERLVEEGRLSKAMAVAARALGASVYSVDRTKLLVLAARAHLAGAEVTRAETFIASAVAIERMTPAGPSPATRDLELEVMFWKGRWQDIRTVLAASPDCLDRREWSRALDWADGRDPSAAGPEVTADGALFRSRPHGERGLAFAVSVAIRKALGTAAAGEIAWLDDLVRREGLRGLARFSEGTSAMQMIRDMSNLMEIVQSAEDETAALARVCDWVRRAAGASAALIAAADGTHIAGDALRTVGSDAGEVARWASLGDAQLEETVIRSIAHAPIRFAGATVAAMAAAGPAECGRAIFAAVQAAAAVAGATVRAKLDALAASAHGDALAGEILGTSPSIAAVRATVARVALAPFAVVIEGESGTGKELVARALHRHSARRDRTFAALNCAALTDELIEAELFGHARGAFTHAINARTGLFEDAHRGTLFLDEVGELSARAQAKLLRTLQEGEIRRVGENETRAVDVRVIAATNRPLAKLAAEGRFREDLMFRLSVVRIGVPPLRERAEDIPQLALEFWRASARRVGTHATLGPDAIAVLTQMPWPGNVRQLQNAMAALSVASPKTGRVGARLVRLVLDGLAGSAAIDAGDIVPLDEARRQFERRVVAAALAKHTGNRADAARALGISRQGLAKALRRLGLAEAGAA